MASQAEVVKLLERFVQSSDTGEQKVVLEDVADRICNKSSSTVLQIVEALGVYLTNQDVSYRRLGTQFLAELMHR